MNASHSRVTKLAPSSDRTLSTEPLVSVLFDPVREAEDPGPLTPSSSNGLRRSDGRGRSSETPVVQERITEAMDGTRFDNLIKRLATRPMTRATALRGLAASAAALTGVSILAGAGEARNNNNNNNNERKRKVCK